MSDDKTLSDQIDRLAIALATEIARDSGASKHDILLEIIKLAEEFTVNVEKRP